MKITKLGTIIFIFFLVISLFPPLMGTSGIEAENVNQSNGMELDQSITSKDLRSNFVNATLVNVERNVTVLADTKVVLEDELELRVLDNDTQIATLNITIPSAFAKYVHQARFFTQFENTLGLINSNNSKDYDVFYGKDVTTYFVDVRQSGDPLNETNGPLFVKSELIAVGAVEVTGYRTGQMSRFMSPLIPMINNLRVRDATIGMGVSGTVESFDSTRIDRTFNRLQQDMPRFTDTENVITYTNMSRTGFDYTQDLLENDMVELFFSSNTPVVQDLQSEGFTAVVPTKISDAERRIVFDPWGTVQVTETITIAHLGGERNETDGILQNIHQLAGYLYTVDGRAVITDVYDGFGSLEQSTRGDDGYPDTTISPSADGKQDLRIDFRTAIYGGETYTFTVEYRYNASAIISQDTTTGQYMLNTTLFSNFNTTADNMEVSISLPAGSNIMGHTFEGKSRFIDYSIYTQVDRRTWSSFSNLEFVISAQNVSYTDNNDFQLFFTLSPAGYLQYAATFLYVAIALLGLLYFVSNLSFNPSKAVEIEKEQIPVDEMDTFFNLFSEKVGAEKRIAELRVKRQKGKLSKKDYDGQVKAIRRRLRDINPQLEKASKELSAQGGRYENYVKRVMLASQRQSDIRRNAREAKLNYEKGNIPKNIYQLRIKEFNEELKKQESTINKTLTEMVETIQKYNQ